MTPDYSIIGKRIKIKRMKKRMTQEELAEKINVSTSFMSRIETGNVQINIKRLAEIADALEVSPGYLLTGINVKSKDYLREDFNLLLKDCTPKQQKLIFEISELVSKMKFEDD